MHNFIFEFCKEIGPRPPCSKEEREAANLFREKMKKYSDVTSQEMFYTNPGPYKAAYLVPMVLYIVSLIIYLFIPWLSLVVSIILLFILFGEMTLTRQVIDFLYSKKQSQNVISKIMPKNQSKELIIIGSHLDSNWEFPLIRIFRNKYTIIFGINVFLNVILFLLLIVKNMSIIFSFQAIFFNIEIIVFWILIITIPFPLIQLFLMILNRPVMGANDNLSGMAVCFELAKNLYAPENRAKNVEVWINAYGCEEIGSKGSRAFIQKHYNEIKNAKVINIDMVGNKNTNLIIGNSEIQGFVKMDGAMIDLIKKSADNLNIEVNVRTIMGYTDSLSFCRKNISATSLSTLPSSSKEYYYHTRDDIIENLSFKNLINTYNICMNVIKELDKE